MDKMTWAGAETFLTAIDEFEELGKTDPLFKKLSESCKSHKGLWNGEAERILFDHFGIDPKKL